MTKYEELIARKSREYPQGTERSFCTDHLASNFIRFYNSGERVKVATCYGEFKYGTIGITTGWRPSFLLMRTRTQLGSSDTLSELDQVVAVKTASGYRAIFSNGN